MPSYRMQIYCRLLLLPAAIGALRRKLPAAPEELKPVPPLFAGTTPSEMFGAVVGFVTESGASAVTPVRVPAPRSN